MAVLKAETIIEAKKLYYSYPGEGEASSPALHGVDLKVDQGEYLALLGANGSGKTTLLKLLNALLRPSQGEVLVKGISTVEAQQLELVRQTCGMIFQNPDNQIVATTVEEDIAFGLENLALPSKEIRRRVDAVAARLGLTHLLQHPPHLLSGGEKQRTAIAGILVMQPACILMDEPTAMLDPSGRFEVLKTVRDLNKAESLSVIHVTHNPAEAMEADRIVILERGRIVADGKPKEILTDLEFLHKLGLQGTVAAELAYLLRREGLILPAAIMRNRELVESLCLSEQIS